MTMQPHDNRDASRDIPDENEYEAFLSRIKTRFFHAIRSTIEAFSRSGQIEGMEESTACGILLSKGVAWGALFRVTTDRQTVEYQLDRWD